MSQSLYSEKPIPVAENRVFLQNLFQGNFSLSKIHLAVHETFNHMPADKQDIFYIAPLFLSNTFKLLENCVITKPEFIHQVLHEYETSQHLHKAAAAQGFLKTWALGPAGIPIVPTGEKHYLLRELVEPYFTKSRIDSYKDILIKLVDQAVIGWKKSAQTGETIQIYPQIQDITRNFIINAIARAHPLQESEMQIFTQFLEHVVGYFVLRTVFTENLVKDENIWGYKGVRELSDAVDASLNKLITHYQRLIDSGEAPDDLLTYLVKATRERSDFTTHDLRDVIIALFLAGYETTAKTISSGLFELSQNSESAKKLQQELTAHLTKTQKPSILPQDINQLSYLKSVAHETLRLWAAPWALQRTSVEGDMIFNDPERQITYRIPAGAQVIISTWSLHRDKRYYDQGEIFMPERWMGGMRAKPSDAIYMPFGGGVRDCVGNGIAWLEINYILGRIFQDFDVAVDHPEKVAFLVRANTIGPIDLPVRLTLRQS